MEGVYIMKHILVKLNKAKSLTELYDKPNDSTELFKQISINSGYYGSWKILCAAPRTWKFIKSLF